jgi:hypothetical protein
MICKHLALGVAAVLGVALSAGCGGGDSSSLLGGGGPGGGGSSGGGGNPSTGVNPGVGGPGGVTPPGGGTPGTGNASPTTAAGYFETDVYPALNTAPGPTTPACTSCHATGDLGAPMWLAGTTPAAAYATVTGPTYISFITVPANSMIVLHGVHTGPALSNAQLAVVTTWLNMEVAARGMNSTPAVTVQGELQKIGQCMKLSDFTNQYTSPAGTASASNIGTDNVTAYYQGNNSPCNTCHSAGDGGFLASSDASTMLTQTVAGRYTGDITYIKKWVTGTVDENGNFSGLVASNAILQNVDLSQTCTIEGDCHPQINLNPAPNQSANLSAIANFVQVTLGYYTANQCP